MQLQETAFIAMILSPLFRVREFCGPRYKFSPPLVGIWMLRWLLFRIMLGAVRDYHVFICTRV